MKKQDHSKESHRPDGTDDLLQKLLRHAGTREKPPGEFERIARESLHAEWRQISDRRKRHRWMIGFAAAASLLVTIGVVVQFAGGVSATEPGVRLAQVKNLTGTALANGPGREDISPLDSGDWLLSGQYLETARGSAIALHWTNGQSVRLDENTRMQLNSAQDIGLKQGRIYVDTNEHAGDANILAISTPAGELRHVGTQYMTEVTPAGTTVSVRSGTVLIDLSGTGHMVKQGEQLSISGDGTRLIQQIQPWGEPWLWAESITPAFASDGKSIADLLAWVETETGRSIQYDSEDAEVLAQTTKLHGRVEQAPMSTLFTVTQTSGMEARVSDGVIFISLVHVD
jgi:ferric-dicitrate binding protein FerR (iron transport regulator)